MQNLHFFTGKGGTGKSTNAILYSLKNVKKEKILLCSLDPAHNIFDILELNSTKQIEKKMPNLKIIEPSIKEMLKKFIGNIENELKTSHSYLSSFNLLNNFNIIKYSPGMEEYAIFYTFQNILSKYKNKYDTLIFDMPPTALSLRFFSLAKLSILWLDKLIELRLKIINKRENINRINLKENTDDKILLNLMKQKEKYIRFKKILLCSKIHIVLNPEHVSISESLNFIEDLDELEYKNIDIYLNKFNGNLPSFMSSLSDKYTIFKISGMYKPTGLDNLLLHLS